MRSFIAIDFDKATKQKIADIQKELKNFSIKGRWKYIDNFHLTLKFLGEINPRNINSIENGLKKVSENTEKFTINFNDLGYFGNKDMIRVVWLGLEGEIEKLKLLNDNIEDELNNIGFEKEKRKFKPHITIAQDVLFNESFDNVKQVVDKYSFSEYVVDRFVLMKSEQIGKKRVYTPIGEYLLKA